MQLAQVRDRSAVLLQFLEYRVQRASPLLEDLLRQRLEGIQHEEFVVGNVADELREEVAVLRRFSLWCSSAPGIPFEGIVVPACDVAEKVDERFGCAFGAVRRAHLNVPLDQVEVVEELGDDEVDLGDLAVGTGRASLTVPVKVSEEGVASAVDLVEEYCCAGAGGHGPTQSHVHVLIVDGEAEHGRFEVSLDNAFLGGA